LKDKRGHGDDNLLPNSRMAFSKSELSPMRESQGLRLGLSAESWVRWRGDRGKEREREGREAFYLARGPWCPAGAVVGVVA
jgi:hypothetical protein